MFVFVSGCSYVGSNPQYADSAVYLVKFRQLQVRSIASPTTCDSQYLLCLLGDLNLTVVGQTGSSSLIRASRACA